MVLMLSKTYDALLAAGAPEDKARDAAEEIAAYENRLTRVAPGDLTAGHPVSGGPHREGRRARADDART
jgi:hypothetical protein